MKKICFLTSTLNYGGATKIMIELANYLTDYFEVSIVNYGPKDNFYSLDKRISVLDAPHTRCNVPKIRLITQMFCIRKYFKYKDYDIILAFGNTEKLMAISATLGRTARVVISERQDPYNYNPGKKHTMWLRYLLADGCVFQTEGAKRYFPKSVQKKSIVIPNFIQIEDKALRPMQDKKKEIAFSARFELKQKRQDVMIKAMKKVVQVHPDWKLVFYGDGADQSIIKKMVNEYGIENNVTFMGKVSGVNEYIYNSAILVLTSDYEGIPNVLLEAMAMGVPVVSTDCSPGGAQLLIEDKYNGLLAPVGDDDEVASAIIYLIDNPEIANYYSRNAIQVKNTYSPEIIFPIWEQYLKGI